MKLFFSYSQHNPRDSSPTTTDPLPRELISSRFSVVRDSILSQLRNATRKSTEKQLEIDSLGRGSVVVGDESRGGGL